MFGHIAAFCSCILVPCYELNVASHIHDIKPQDNQNIQKVGRLKINIFESYCSIVGEACRTYHGVPEPFTLTLRISNSNYVKHAHVRLVVKESK
jgi:hypothetical protein